MPLPPTRDAAPTTGEASLLYCLTSVVERLDWARMFPQPQLVEIELGSGDGSFLVEWAQRHPERNFLGIERLFGRLRKLDRKGRRARLTNLLGLCVEGVYFTDYLAPPASVAAFHIYFPDPWPKVRHAKNRLIQPRFAALLHRALVPGGVVHLRTDHGEYFAWMLEVFRGAVGFCEVETPPELLAIMTDFERDFAAKGIAANRASFRKLEIPSPVPDPR